MIAILIAVGIVVVALFVGVVVWMMRAPRQEPGVASFRRHIDALSPESRREVMERVQRGRGGDPPGGPDGS